jgi:hypothetical protein
MPRLNSGVQQLWLTAGIVAGKVFIDLQPGADLPLKPEA